MSQENTHPFRILFIVDGSLDRPLLHSQGIPLLKRLSQKGIVCYVQSFESSMAAAQGDLGDDLARHNIIWRPVLIDEKVSNWQRIRMITSGFFEALKLCHKEKIDVIHCRSYRPGVMGSLIKTFLGNGFLFDMRGFMIDEFIANGYWNENSIKYRIAKQVERLLILSADVITVTSPQFMRHVLALPYFPASRANDVLTIPNCVDVNRFPLANIERQQSLRERFGWNGRLVSVFAGDPIRYRDTLEEIICFFDALKSVRSDAYLVLAVTGNPNALKSERLFMLGEENFTIATIPPQDMPDYLAAADIGLSFLKNKNFAIAITSPIKFAEYLSCGLPVVINPGIGDTSRIIEQHGVGIVIDPMDSDQIKSKVMTLLKLLTTDTGLRQRCHNVAKQELSLEFAVDHYEKAYQQTARTGTRAHD